MERLTNATINVICASILFITLFSACSKKPQANNYFENEKYYIEASKELEQGYTTQPVDNYVSPVAVLDIHPVPANKDSVTTVAKKPFHHLKKSQKQAVVDPLIYSENRSYHPASAQTNKAAAAEPSVLRWFRLLAFLPIALAILLMTKVVAKVKRKEQGTMVLGGLISILLVILLIVVILALI